MRAKSTDIVAFAIHYLDLDLLPKVGLLSLAHIVLTDSGGIQEEAPSLGNPVLVMRDTTERPEGVLAGTDRDRIVSEIFSLLDEPNRHLEMSRAHNPFGDGHASKRIVKVMLDG